MIKSSLSLIEFCRDWPIRRRLVVVAADGISMSKGQAQRDGLLLIKQVRDVSDMISEHEGVNAVASDSLS